VKIMRDECPKRKDEEKNRITRSSLLKEKSVC